MSTQLPLPFIVLLLATHATPASSLPPILEGLLDTTHSGKGERVFVKYKSGHHDDTLRSLQRQTRMFDSSSPTKLLFDFEPLDAYVMDIATTEELKALRRDPMIEEIHQDPPRTYQMLDSVKPYQQKKTPRNGNTGGQEIPYGVEMVQAPDAWRLGIKGAGVKICVIDTGIDLYHEDLDRTKVDGSASSSSSWFTDEIGHGTHVAGTIAAVDNQLGVVGVAPEAEIYTIKHFTDDSGLSFASTLISAAYKCQAAGAKIINMSLSGPFWNPFEMAVFNGLMRDGILSFAAAGNDGDRRPEYPASYNSVTSVAAVDQNEQHASFSNRNNRVDLAAPGVDIFSLLPKGGNCHICQSNPATSGYGITSGTSMATPHAAGVAALLWSYKPEASAYEILQAMEDSAKDLGDAGHDSLYGHGLINAMDALTALNGGYPLAAAANGSATSASLEVPLMSVQSLISQHQDDPSTVAEDDGGESRQSSGFFSWFSIATVDDTAEACDPGFVEFKMSLQTDEYATETKWALSHAMGNTEPLFSESDFESSKTYHYRKCIPSDCYAFTIQDEAKDGICCDYGRGSFSVSYGGQQILSGGDFLSQEYATMGTCATSLTTNVVGSNPNIVGATNNDTIISIDDSTETDNSPVLPAAEDIGHYVSEWTGIAARNNNETANNNCWDIILDLTTDNYPGETSFQLIDVSSQQDAMIIWDFSDFDNYRAYQYKTCQDPNGCYEFTIKDSEGDGLCCEYGFGGIELSFGGNVVASYSAFEDQVQVQFGEGCTSALVERNGKL